MAFFSISKTYSCCLLLMLLIFAASKDLQVDCNLSSPNDPVYPSLQESLSALLTEQNLTEANNTITLQNSCLTVPQYFNGTKIGPAVTNGGSISITYSGSMPSILNSSDACNQLPTLILSDASYINLEYLTSFSISGVNIQYLGSKNLNSIYSINTVNFTSMCFNNSELEARFAPSDDITPPFPSDYKDHFSIDQAITFIMTNGAYLFDQQKQLTITNTAQVTIDSVSILILSTHVIGGPVAFNINGDNFATDVTISNILIECIPYPGGDGEFDANGFNMNDFVLPNLFWSSNIKTILISSLSWSNCYPDYFPNFNLPINQQSVIYVVNASSLMIENLNLTNLLFAQVNQSFCYISAVSSTVVSNISLIDSIAYYSLEFLSFSDEIPGQNYPMLVTLNGIFIENSVVVSPFIYVLFSNYANYGEISIQNFVIQNCNAAIGNVLWLLMQSPDDDSLSETIKYINLNDITLSSNFISTELFYLALVNSTSNKATEVFHLEVNNYNSNGNDIFDSSVFYLEGILMHIKDSSMQDDLYSNSANFYLNQQIVSTFLMSNTTAYDIWMYDDSVFISSDATGTRSRYYEVSYVVGGLDDGGILGTYVETRPFMIYNCSFINTFIGDSTSSLIYSVSSQIILRQNIFSQVTTSGTFLTLGNYIFFLVWNSLVSSPDSVGGWIVPTAPILPFYAVEQSIFQDYPDLYIIYNTSRDTTDNYNLSPSKVMFILLQDSIFESITADTDYIILFTNFDQSNGTIVSLNNQFINISSNTTANIFGITNIPYGYYRKNSLTGGNFMGYFFDADSTLSLTIFDSNSLVDSSQCGLFSIQSDECDELNITSNYVLNLQVVGTFIDITCTLMSQVVFQNLTVENISQQARHGIVTSLNFLSLQSEESSFDSDPTYILFKDCHFSNMTIMNNQYLTQEVFQSSFLFIIVAVEALQFESVSFDTMSALPKGGILISAAATVTISDSILRNLGFGNANGAFLSVVQNLTILNCSFEDNYGLNSDGAGLFKIINSDPLDAILRVTIQSSAFSNNTAPYGSIIYTQDAPIHLIMNDTQMLNNQVTSSGGLIELLNVNSSTILINNSNYLQTQGYSEAYSQLKVLSLENSQNDISITLSNVSIVAQGSIYGVFISVTSFQPVIITASQTKYQVESTQNGSNLLIPQFGFLQADNFDATVTTFQANDISLDQTPIFIINCNTAGKQNYEWSLTLEDSNFSGLILNEAIFLITSDANLPLDTFALIITNTTFSNISWAAEGTSTSSGGVISSSTALIGRTTPLDDNDFAIVLRNCTCSSLSGVSSLIFGTIESMVDSVMLIDSSLFTDLSTSGVGAIINPSTTALSTFTSQLNANNPRNESYKISSCSIMNIQGQGGCLMYWESQTRGISVTVVGTIITNVNCSQDGGIFYMMYGITNSTLAQLVNSSLLTEEFKIIFTSKNVSYENIRTNNGGILFFNGENRLLQIDFEENLIENATTAQNGGLFYVSSATSTETTITNSRLLSQAQLTVGNLLMFGNTFTGVSAIDGGIIYEITTSDTLEIILDSNIFHSISVASRGGAMYVWQPFLTVTNNTFSNVSAKYAGNLIYSVSGNVDLSDLTTENTISPASTTPVSFAPTTLDVKFISLTDGSVLQLESDNSSTYNPQVSNLTSYSLSEYQIAFTLVYEGEQGYQVVFDESRPQITLLFTAQKAGSSTQSFDGSNCSNSTCTALASDVILKGLAGSLITVNATYQSIQYTMSRQFNIKLRGCIPGEVNETSISECIYCDVETYSLTPNDSKCFDCPVGATCHGGNNISINTGYFWSTSSQTELFVINCNDSGARCIGGYGNSTCSETFMGPVCLQCNLENNYLSASKVGECSVCYEKQKLIGYAIALVLSSLAYQILMIYITYNENKSIHNLYQMNKGMTAELKPGQFMVIFSTFSQITSILSDMNVGAVESLMGISNTVGNSNTQVIFSLQCIYLLVTPDNFEGLRFQVMIYVLSPAVKVVIAAIFELIRNLIWKDKEGKGRKKSLIRIGSVAVVLIILEQPGIIGILCEYLSCTRLDPLVDEYYIKLNSNVQCFTDKYNFFARLFVIPALIFWAFVVPLTIFTILYKKKKELYTSQGFRIVFGNYYNSYPRRARYWGVVIMWFKITIFVLNSVLLSSDTFKGLIFMIIVHIYYYHLRKKPRYNNTRLIFGEKCCCIAYMVMLTLVFFRESSDSEAIQVICAVLIVIVIAIAGGYLLTNMLILYMSKVLEIFKQMKEKKQLKGIVKETLGSLKRYHEDASPERFDSPQYSVSPIQRRKAIAVDLPLRLRNTELYEKERNSPKERSNTDHMRKKKTLIKKTFIELFAGGSIPEPEVHQPKQELVDISPLDPTERIGIQISPMVCIKINVEEKEDGMQTVKEAEAEFQGKREESKETEEQLPRIEEVDYDCDHDLGTLDEKEGKLKPENWRVKALDPIDIDVFGPESSNNLPDTDSPRRIQNDFKKF